MVEQADLGEELPDFPVRQDELRTKPMDHKKVRAWYEERSGLEGRYRVMESIDGAGPGVVRGRTSYRETDDFAHLRNVRYQYSPYLFEALLQLSRLPYRGNGPLGAAIDDSPGDRRDEVFAKMPGRGTDNRGGPPAAAGR